jgi:hypothetical protein
VQEIQADGHTIRGFSRRLAGQPLVEIDVMLAEKPLDLFLVVGQETLQSRNRVDDGDPVVMEGMRGASFQEEAFPQASAHLAAGIDTIGEGEVVGERWSYSDFARRRGLDHTIERLFVEHMSEGEMYDVALDESAKVVNAGRLAEVLQEPIEPN